MRAEQTAQTIAEALHISGVTCLDELRERQLGALENQPKQHEGAWYFADIDQSDVETQIELFRRMQTCLGRITALSEAGTVLAVGHAIAGFYLTQVALGKKSIPDFDALSEMSNADFITLPLR